MVPPGVSYMPRDFMPTKTVLHEIKPADAIRAPQLIERGEQLRRRKRLASSEVASPRSKPIVMYGRLVGRALGSTVRE